MARPPKPAYQVAGSNHTHVQGLSLKYKVLKLIRNLRKASNFIKGKDPKIQRRTQRSSFFFKVKNPKIIILGHLRNDIASM